MVFILIFSISDPVLAQSQTLLSIDVTPANPTITVGQTQQFTATGTFSGGTTGGTWSATGSMTTGRWLHTSTLLPNGKVLIAGGFNGTTPVASADLYDPNTGTWTATGNMTTARWLHTAILLPNGKVLIAGGQDNNITNLSSSEIYDPNTGTWTATGNMANGRLQHSATLLPNGKVLIAGGYNGTTASASADLYTPTPDITWSSSNTAVAAIDANGLATGNSPGTATITATSGTISGSTTLTVATSDTTPPVIVPTVTPASNAAGWNNSNVTVSWSVTDPESGISSSSGCTSTSLVTETSGTVLTCVATNGAGLSNSAFVTIKIDKTPPTISVVSSPLPNSAGWNNTNLTVSYTCTDSLSGISSCSGPATVTTEGSGQVIAGSAMDIAGNSQVASVTLNIDKTPPAVNITGVTNGATYTLGCAPTANFTATDTLSGVATSNGSLTGGNANGVGGFTYTANATDVAGNSITQAANYSVAYNFIGFLQPINNDGSSIFKLGSAIPIKYQLTDCNGVAITTVVGTLSIFKITDAVLGIVEEVTVDSTGAANTDNLFRYSAPNYIYNLDTKPYTSGTYRLQATLDDGTVHTVIISLKAK